VAISQAVEPREDLTTKFTKREPQRTWS